MNVLNTRTPRERSLIICAVALIVLLALWQFGVRPVLNQKMQALQSQTLALRDLDIVQRGLPKIQLPQGPAKAAFTRTDMIAAARSANVAINRVQPAPGGAIQVWFEDTESSRIYNLLAVLSARFNLEINRVQITRRETSLVSAQVTLAPR